MFDLHRQGVWSSCKKKALLQQDVCNFSIVSPLLQRSRKPANEVLGGGTFPGNPRTPTVGYLLPHFKRTFFSSTLAWFWQLIWKNICSQVPPGMVAGCPVGGPSVPPGMVLPGNNMGNMVLPGTSESDDGSNSPDNGSRRNSVDEQIYFYMPSLQQSGGTFMIPCEPVLDHCVQYLDLDLSTPSTKWERRSQTKCFQIPQNRSSTFTSFSCVKTNWDKGSNIEILQVKVRISCNFTPIFFRTATPKREEEPGTVYKTVDFIKTEAFNRFQLLFHFCINCSKKIIANIFRPLFFAGQGRRWKNTSTTSSLSPSEKERDYLRNKTRHICIQLKDTLPEKMTTNISNILHLWINVSLEKKTFWTEGDANL